MGSNAHLSIQSIAEGLSLGLIPMLELASVVERSRKYTEALPIVLARGTQSQTAKETKGRLTWKSK